jgi:hypothetical protein
VFGPRLEPRIYRLTETRSHLKTTTCSTSYFYNRDNTSALNCAVKSSWSLTVTAEDWYSVATGNVGDMLGALSRKERLWMAYKLQESHQARARRASPDPVFGLVTSLNQPLMCPTSKDISTQILQSFHGTGGKRSIFAATTRNVSAETTARGWKSATNKTQHS